ncbi:MAG: carboxypeptidase-like regulatory domain-containing protein [Gemmatimonadales bacterium]
MPRFFSPIALAGVVLSPLCSHAAVAQRDSGAAITGIVRDAGSGRALAFAVVDVPIMTLRRFATDSGRFRLAPLPPGPIVVSVRHLGFSPRDLHLTLRARQDTTIVVLLSPIAVNLTAMAIHASRSCDDPGPPRSADDSAFAAVFDQLRENALQYHLLTTAYPFAALIARAVDAEQHDGSLDNRSRDTVVFRSEHPWPYRVGAIIERSTDARAASDYVMHIPTLDVLADSAFLGAHCFSNGGLETRNGQTRLRVDFRVASDISTPDVDGSMYLDTASYQIRRTVVRLSRRPRELPFIDSAVVTTDFSELYPSLPVVTSIVGRNRLYYPSRPTAPRASIETQSLISLAWERGRPGDPTALTATPLLASRQPVASVILVVDSASGRPLVGAQIVNRAGDSAELTGLDGRARLEFLPDAGGEVLVRQIGYAPRTVRVPPAPSDTQETRVALSKAVALATVRINAPSELYVSPALRRFEERRRLGLGGYFIGASILRREESRNLGNVLRSHVPGTMIAEGAHSAAYLLKSPRCVEGGPPQVYLDGVPLAAPPLPGSKPNEANPTTARGQAVAIPPFDLSEFNVSDLAGIEYYPDGTQLPEEFDHTSTRCGALLLWTREK